MFVTQYSKAGKISEMEVHLLPLCPSDNIWKGGAYCTLCGT